MDFIVFSALLGAVFNVLVFSYDICCQWSCNVTKRVPQLPQHMQIDKSVLEATKRVIPKMHILNHGAKCQVQYNTNYIQYSAQSDLEDPERWWAHINPVASSTREMMDGARYDLINFHTIAWNWQKIVGFRAYHIHIYVSCSSSLS